MRIKNYLILLSLITLIIQSQCFSENIPDVIDPAKDQNLNVNDMSKLDRELISNKSSNPSQEEFDQPDQDEPLEQEPIIAQEIEGDKKQAEKKPKKEEHKEKKLSTTYMTEYLRPWKTGEENDLLTIHFVDADLTNFVKFIEQKYDVKFLMDDDIQPTPQGGKNVLGNKISFKSNVPMTRKQVWDLFLTLLDLSGLAVVPGPSTKILRITTSDPKSPLSSNKGPLPTFIGTDPDLLPDNDARIRYIYFVENTSVAIIKSVMDAMRSASSSSVIDFPELRAIILTDKASTIKSLMKIVVELDRVNMPEMISVIKLKNADADKIAALYKALTEDGSQPSSPFGPRFATARRASSTTYFPEGTRIIPYIEKNKIVILGTKAAIEKIENFIKSFDQEITAPYSPLNIIQLKFIDATTTAQIITDATKFQQTTAAGMTGGVRGGEKYFKPVTITPEATSNSLIINADYEDYKKIQELVNKLDREQPQVAIKVLILDVDITDNKYFGTQLRNKIPGVAPFIGKNTNFQNTGITGVVQNPNGTGATRLLGDLINVVSGAAAGTTFVSLGNDIYGVWGMLQMLQNFTKVSLVADPFLVATHKHQARIAIGQTRRVLAAQVVGGSSTTADSIMDLPANLEVKLTPLINYDGTVYLDVNVTLQQFTSTDPTSGDRTEKTVATSALVADREVLALGGLVRTQTTATQSKFPLLGDIPFIGWLFKNKNKVATKSSILILISPELIMPDDADAVEDFTARKMNVTRDLLKSMRRKYEQRDPVYRWVFDDKQKEQKDKELVAIDKFANDKTRYLDDRFFETTQATKATLAIAENAEKAENVPGAKSKPKKSLVDYLDLKDDKIYGALND